MTVRPESNDRVISNWLVTTLQSVLKATRKRRHRNRATSSVVQMILTELEDRSIPATLSWIGAAGAGGNLWGTASNWLQNQVPANGDRLVVASAETANGTTRVYDRSGGA
mgnify:CR=1 FL=1